LRKDIWIPAHIRARIIGIVLIGVGCSIILINSTSLNIKIGFATILIGVFMCVMVTEKSIPQKTSDIQIEGNMQTIKKIITELDLKGNAIFLPKSDIQPEERILIPPNESGVIKIPSTVYNNIFLYGKDGEKLGISVPPSGLKLLGEIEKNGKFENTSIENIEEKLQLFVGMSLIKYVSFKKNKNGWNLEIEKNGHSIDSCELLNQYPGPIISAIITAITRALSRELRIYKVTNTGSRIIFQLNIMQKRGVPGDKK
jgi:hypothetical protein